MADDHLVCTARAPEAAEAHSAVGRPTVPGSLRAYLPPAPGGRQRRRTSWTAAPARPHAGAPLVSPLLPEGCQDAFARSRLAVNRANPIPRGRRGEGARECLSRRTHARCSRVDVLQSGACCDSGFADCPPRWVVNALPRASWKVVSWRRRTPGDARGGWGRLPGPGADVLGAHAHVCQALWAGWQAVV